MIALLGSGLIGRILALELADRGFAIQLFDADDFAGLRSCGRVAAGLLSPYAELLQAERTIFDLGLRARELWPAFLAKLQQPVLLQLQGSLMVAHPQDQVELQRIATSINKKLNLTECEAVVVLQRENLQQLEPDLSNVFQHGLYFPLEGQIASDEFFAATQQAILQRSNINWKTHCSVTQVEPYRVQTAEHMIESDLVIDCRGLGAKNIFPQLRGVRGEIITVVAPEVNLRRPVRLWHPRYAIYIAPRANHHFVIGATSIESEDFSPISVQSMLELLSAAYSVHRGFAEARIVETYTQCRPALPDNLPAIHHTPGLIAVNGLYRHGYLIAPALVEQIIQLIEQH